jgi:hypothetical protein
MTVGGVAVRLADELFLIALDDRTGRFRLSPKVLGSGLAGRCWGSWNLSF